MLPYAGSVRAALGPAGAALLVAGGLAYSIGGIIYAMRWPDPYPRRAASPTTAEYYVCRPARYWLQQTANFVIDFPIA